MSNYSDYLLCRGLWGGAVVANTGPSRRAVVERGRLADDPADATLTGEDATLTNKTKWYFLWLTQYLLALHFGGREFAPQPRSKGQFHHFHNNNNTTSLTNHMPAILPHISTSPRDLLPMTYDLSDLRYLGHILGHRVAVILLALR